MAQDTITLRNNQIHKRLIAKLETGRMSSFVIESIVKDRPLVSILINNYNYGRFLGEAIDSALNQTYPNTEVVVVDDGSTDNSREIISSYQDKVIPVLKENGGQASAFNAGFKACKGDIICFLDSDDTFLPEKVMEIVEVFRQHQDIGWCFNRVRLVDTDTGELLGLSRESLSGKCDFRLHMRIMGRRPFVPPATSGLSFTRSLLQQILPMPEIITITSDEYLKATAIALSKGFLLNKQLTIQKIHGDNKYTEKNNKLLKSKIAILTAFAMRNNWQFLARFANRMFAQGCVNYWRTKEVNPEYQEIIRSYLSTVSLLEKLEINLNTFYYRLKGV